MEQQKPSKPKIFFVHVPKTGGTWFDQTMSKYMEGDQSFFSPIESYMQLGLPSGTFSDSLRNRYGWHVSIHESMLAGYNFDDYLTVSICRNPFDMLVSMYYHHSTDEISTRYKNRKGPSGWGSANISHNIASFSEFIKRFCDPSVPWVHPQFRKFLFHQMYQPDGTCGVDVVLRYEMLPEATGELVSRIHQANIANGVRSELPAAFDPTRVNVSKKRRKKDYRAYYTDELRELVEHACAAELRLFNYNFDGIVSDSERPNPIVVPTNTFYHPGYPIAMAGFSVEEQKKFSYILQRSASDMQVKLNDMTSLTDVLINLSGIQGLEKTCLWACTHWQAPNPAVEAINSMGYKVVCDSEDIRRHMIDGKIHGEWLPLIDHRKEYFENILSNPEAAHLNRFLVTMQFEGSIDGVSLEPAPEHYNENAARENAEYYQKLNAEYDELKRTHELNARLRDMGVDPESVSTLDREST